MIRTSRLHRKEKVRSGIRDAEVRREFPRHRRFIRSFRCCVPDCDDGPIEVAHVRHANNAGVGIKPFDWSAISLCQAHHSEQHNIGALSFQKKYGIDMDELAVELARRSPDDAMKEALVKALAMGEG